MNTYIANSIKHEISKINTTPLSAIKGARLMRRVDTKYVFNVELLPRILSSIKNDYNLVEINDKVIHGYETMYYDTPNLDFYHNHHNGARSRYKIRFRRYVDSNLAFFEIKQKTNKNETIKSRVEHTEVTYSLQKRYIKLATKELKSFEMPLSPSISNNFFRITLVHKSIPERVTIDYNIFFDNLRLNKNGAFEKICVVEIKKDFGTKNISFSDVLKNMKIRPIGFSKYCMGVVFSNPSVKQNLFKPRLLRINKIIN